MTEHECEICAFRNPRATVTAVIVKEKKLLLAKRTEEPFKGWWDLIGGYMHEKEMPEDALKRELKEELGVDSTLTFLDFFPGYASWKGKDFPILSLVYLAELRSDTVIPNEEIEELKWFSKAELPQEVAFDSNNNIVHYVKTRGII